MIHTEYKIQAATFKHHQSAFPFVKFVFIPNASRDAATGFFNKQMGLHPGAFDIHLFWNRWSIDSKPEAIKVGIYEEKSEDGEKKGLSTAQNRYASEMHNLGAYYGYGSTVKAYHQTLKRWGLIPLHDAIKEPDLRTKEQKFKDAFDLYKRPDL